MKTSRFLLPFAILTAGVPFLAWQRGKLATERARAQAAAASLAQLTGGTVPADTRTASRVTTTTSPHATAPAPATSTPPSAATPVEPVGLASLTQGVEATLDLGKGGDQLLQTPIIEAVAALTLDQLRATFQTVTDLIKAIPPDQLARGRAQDPEQQRAMLLLTPLMGRLQRESPETALTWMASPDLPAFLRQNAGRFAEETVRSFAQTNPQAALAWLEQNASRLPESAHAWPAALGALAATDLPRALREATDRGVLPETLKNAIPALTSPEARHQWSDAVMTIDDPARRSRRWSALVEHQIATDGWQAALTVLHSELPAEARTRQTLQPVVEAGVAEAPTTLADHLATLPPESSTQLVPECIARWTERDYNAAASWLRLAPPDSPWRDAAVATFVAKIRSLDADAARTWAATIQNPTLRTQATAPKQETSE